MWFGFSMLQIIIYYKHGLNEVDWPAIRGLRNFWVYLLLFQILRWLSLRFQKKEFVALGKSQTDLYDNRRITTFDCLLFVIAISLLFLLQIN